VIDGAAVRVSLVCFDGKDGGAVRIDGEAVAKIYSDLSASSSGFDLTHAVTLAENAVAYIGDQKTGPFDIGGSKAREWLLLPLNPNGRSNAEVLSPWANGMDLTRRQSGKWIIDFGVTRSETEAALYEAPFSHVASMVRARRRGLREQRADEKWWIHQRPRPEMRTAIASLKRYIATPRVAKHRVLCGLTLEFCPTVDSWLSLAMMM
jgi:hypothetical protein